MSVKSSLKAAFVRTYRRLPMGIRNGVRSNRFLDHLRQRYFLGDTSLHDQFYAGDYYASCDEGKWAAEAAPQLASDIVQEFRPGSIIDVGCGRGEYLEAFRMAGLETHGIELASEAVKICLAKGLDVVPIDLTSAKALPWRADVVFSVEVAEHLPATGARNYVKLLTGAAREHVVMTAARPDQPGLNHINCQPKEYWIKMIGEEGFDFDAGLVDRWEATNRSRNLAPWFFENLMIFHRRSVNG